MRQTETLKERQTKAIYQKIRAAIMEHKNDMIETLKDEGKEKAVAMFEGYCTTLNGTTPKDNTNMLWLTAAINATNALIRNEIISAQAISRYVADKSDMKRARYHVSKTGKTTLEDIGGAYIYNGLANGLGVKLNVGKSITVKNISIWSDENGNHYSLTESTITDESLCTSDIKRFTKHVETAVAEYFENKKFNTWNIANKRLDVALRYRFLLCKVWNIDIKEVEKEIKEVA